LTPIQVRADEVVTLNQSLVASVIESALRFIHPRTLEPQDFKTFCFWGLDGLTAIDPSISLTMSPSDGRTAQTVRMDIGQKEIASFNPPNGADLASCVQFTIKALSVAWAHSKILRAAGQEALMQSFFDELFNHLDPYSRYVGPDPAADDRRERSGDEGNIGVTLGLSHDAVIISSINANGPAWSAGLDAGTYLLAVNGQRIKGDNLDEIAAMLQGPAGRAVRLTLRKPGEAAFEQEIRLQQVPPQTVYIEVRNRVAIFRITAFSSDTAEELSQYLDQALTEDKIRALVLDLRGDRGGVLQQAVTAVALVLNHGIAVVTKGRDPQANHIWTVQGGDMTQNLPIAILVDGRTASAAEILAAALADHRRAVVIGSATLGKGLVQAVGQMPNKGEIFVTWSRVLAPLGWPLQGVGIIPQICTSRGSAYLQEQLSALQTGHLLNESLIRVSRDLRYPVPVPRILEIRRQCPAALGTDADLDVARSIVTHPLLYKAALRAIPDIDAPNTQLP